MWPACPLQVILKPDPGNAQELYLGSLEALGIDTKVGTGQQKTDPLDKHRLFLPCHDVSDCNELSVCDQCSYLVPVSAGSGAGLSTPGPCHLLCLPIRGLPVA